MSFVYKIHSDWEMLKALKGKPQEKIADIACIVARKGFLRSLKYLREIGARWDNDQIYYSLIQSGNVRGLKWAMELESDKKERLALCVYEAALWNKDSRFIAYIGVPQCLSCEDSLILYRAAFFSWDVKRAEMLWEKGARVAEEVWLSNLLPDYKYCHIDQIEKDEDKVLSCIQFCVEKLGVTPFLVKWLVRRSFTRCLDYLISKGAPIHEGLLQNALSEKQWDCAQYLIQKGAMLKGIFPLIYSDHSHTIMMYLQMHPYTKIGTTYNTNFTIKKACYFRSMALVKYAVENSLEPVVLDYEVLELFWNTFHVSSANVIWLFQREFKRCDLSEPGLYRYEETAKIVWAARTIEKAMVRAWCDPEYSMCHKRLLRDFEELTKANT